ncbi:N-alpha-acetyltransferase 20 [Aphelenchoides fujianensis]|nr:N-alpha-acetyltransferase 20 [Aphelenchoides fujianensis]
MKLIREFQPADLLNFNIYSSAFYLSYNCNFPEYFLVCQHPSGAIMGYIMGKAEGRGENWHGHGEPPTEED